MSTRHVTDRLPLWVGGDLPEAEAAGILEHLAGCEACRREAAALQESRAWLQAAPAAPFTEEEQRVFRRELMVRIQAEGSKPRPVPRIFPWKPALLAAAGFLAAGFLLRGLKTKAGSPDAPPPAQAALVAPDPALKPVTASLQRPAPLPSRREPPPPELPAGSGPTRIELQTDNPNVRIIWLARAAAMPSLPDESNPQ
jgi:anti-sigma factor RsiW